MARSGILKFGLCLLIAMAIASFVPFRVSEARPLGPAGGSPLARGVEAMIQGLYLEAIKTGGPSSGGKGHGFTTYFTNSGPSPGEGH
ncbi:hypothetical protein SAY87_004934 [Trapa incisa]|uniref:Transmembrane protein n=2 Tax=Trapa TaxID=22665 RepID=A0AAN7R1N5_TRANT|nr:hypothetical protein SAY87_004934 [Trapa incisa]KAK4782583.1 hypothetical protein SAY86_016685 [Trapa natans]